jgi:phosphoglycerol transferase MdoB-like AlkP superfamily enzyme
MRLATICRWGRDPFTPVALVALGLSIYKVRFLEDAGRTLFECSFCLASRGALHEGEFLLLVFLLHLLALLLRKTSLAGLFRLLAVAALMIQVLDLITASQFQMRLTLHKLMEFAGEPGAVVVFLRSLPLGASAPMLAAAGLVAVAAIRYVVSQPQALPSVRGPLIGVLACIPLIAVGRVELHTPSYHEAYLRNALETFFDPETRLRAYTPAFVQSVRRPEPAQQCDTGLGARPDLILVIVESLSVYQSARFSGLHDWTPQLDALSDSALRMTSFRANGVTSEEGLIALLTGEPAIPKPGPIMRTLLQQFTQTRETLPRFLNGLGYRTEFLTTGNLGFMDKGKWLDAIGFQYREGHNSHFYDGMKRFNFDAATDEALYERALTELGTGRAQPLFMTLETVSSHHPYSQPETGERTEESVFRYADAQLGRFVAKLRQAGYFDRGGVVLVTGDHRAMVPMTNPELIRMGDRAYSRVPMVVIGNGLHGEVSDTFSQSDLLPSLQHWLGTERHCVAANQGVFLPGPAERPACLFTTRPYHADLVVAECGVHDFHILLDGDASHFEDPQPGPPGLMASVHRLRLGQGF